MVHMSTPVPGTVAAPVTTSVTRHVDPSRTSEMLAWVQAGTSLAERFDGFLGSGWVRPSEESPDWHMLYRFASADALAAWEASPQRAWWLEAAQGQIEETRVERRTGIEGWFDQPVPVEADRTPTPPPPRYKQMVTIFLVFFPLSLTANWVSGQLIGDWPLPLRVLASVLVMTPLMTYVLLPWVTRKMAWWLHR
jgi:antibiotic biosynthesis monooxygenase (ABM) superfamily enzyme